MRILYDHQAFRLGKFAGIPRYCTELISRYFKDSDITPILPIFWSTNRGYRELEKSYENITWNVRDSIVDLSLKIFHQNPSRLIDGAERKSCELLKKKDFDLFHPTNDEPYFLPYIGNKPYVLTIHDLTPEKYPESTPKAARSIEYASKIIGGAVRYIAISKSTKNDLIAYFDVEPELIDIVYHGSPLEKYSLPKRTEYQNSDNRYILYVGIRFPHKNFHHFLVSISPLLRENRIKLICSGGGNFTKMEVSLIQALKISDKIVHINADDQKLISLYQNAVAFVYPSLNEGFGLPLLEAFSCGCPVLCSNTSSLPEICGDAALYFDPKNPNEIRESILKVLDNEKLAKKMIDSGYARLSNFSWDKAAKETKETYKKALE